MPKSTPIYLEPETRLEAERLFSSFGITLNDAINIFINQALMVGGLPFEVKKPRYNLETEAALMEARDIMAGKTKTEGYKSSSELFQALDSEC